MSNYLTLTEKDSLARRVGTSFEYQAMRQIHDKLMHENWWSVRCSEQDPEDEYIMARRPLTPKSLAELVFGEKDFPPELLSNLHSWLPSNSVKFESKYGDGEHCFVKGWPEDNPDITKNGVPILRHDGTHVTVFPQRAELMEKKFPRHTFKPYTFAFEEFQKEALRETFRAIEDAGIKICLLDCGCSCTQLSLKIDTPSLPFVFDIGTFTPRESWALRLPRTYFDDIYECASGSNSDIRNWLEVGLSYDGLSKDDLHERAEYVVSATKKAAANLDIVQKKYGFSPEAQYGNGFLDIGANFSTFMPQSVLERIEEPLLLPTNAIDVGSLAKDLSITKSDLFKFLETQYPQESTRPEKIDFVDGKSYFTPKACNQIWNDYRAFVAKKEHETALSNFAASVDRAMKQGISLQEMIDSAVKRAGIFTGTVQQEKDFGR